MYAFFCAFIMYMIEEVYIHILISLLAPRTKEEQHPLVHMNKSLARETVCRKEVAVAKNHVLIGSEH